MVRLLRLARVLGARRRHADAPRVEQALTFLESTRHDVEGPRAKGQALQCSNLILPSRLNSSPRSGGRAKTTTLSRDSSTSNAAKNEATKKCERTEFAASFRHESSNSTYSNFESAPATFGFNFSVVAEGLNSFDGGESLTTFHQPDRSN